MFYYCFISFLPRKRDGSGWATYSNGIILTFICRPTFVPTYVRLSQLWLPYIFCPTTHILYFESDLGINRHYKLSVAFCWISVDLWLMEQFLHTNSSSNWNLMNAFVIRPPGMTSVLVTLGQITDDDLGLWMGKLFSHVSCEIYRE